MNAFPSTSDPSAPTVALPGSASQQLTPPPGTPMGGDWNVAGFRVLKELGRGGMGVVYEAWDENLHRPVALKIIHPNFAAMTDFVERFRIEARSVARLSHPNIVAVYALHEVGSPCLVMELIRGEDLGGILKAKGAMDPRKAMTIIRDAARGLGHAASQRIVHRDVKPSNIVLTDDGVAKVMDFGLSKAMDGAASLTGSGVVGSPHFMAPEQARGDHVDERADVYSLGCTYFALLAGKPPFVADSLTGILFKQMNEPLPIPAHWRGQFGAGVVDLLEQMTAKDRDQRPKWNEVLMALDAMLEGAAPPTVSRTMSRPRMTASAAGPSRRWMWAGIAGAACLLVGAVAWVVMVLDRPAILPPPVPLAGASSGRLELLPTPADPAPEPAAVAPQSSPVAFQPEAQGEAEPLAQPMAQPFGDRPSGAGAAAGDPGRLNERVVSALDRADLSAAWDELRVAPFLTPGARAVQTFIADAAPVELEMDRAGVAKDRDQRIAHLHKMFDERMARRDGDAVKGVLLYAALVNDPDLKAMWERAAEHHPMPPGIFVSEIQNYRSGKPPRPLQRRRQ